MNRVKARNRCRVVLFVIRWSFSHMKLITALAKAAIANTHTDSLKGGEIAREKVWSRNKD